jgi:hypothetical protein
MKPTQMVYWVVLNGLISIRSSKSTSKPSRFIRMRLSNEFETLEFEAVWLLIESSVSLLSGVKPLKMVSDDFKNIKDSNFYRKIKNNI